MACWGLTQMEAARPLGTCERSILQNLVPENARTRMGDACRYAPSASALAPLIVRTKTKHRQRESRGWHWMEKLIGYSMQMSFSTIRVPSVIFQIEPLRRVEPCYP